MSWCALCSIALLNCSGYVKIECVGVPSVILPALVHFTDLSFYCKHVNMTSQYSSVVLKVAMHSPMEFSGEEIVKLSL